MITIRDLMYAAKLKALRGQKNIKQFHAACIIGIECQQHYSDFESGKKHFTEDIIRQICNGFKIPISEFKYVNLGILEDMVGASELQDHMQTYTQRVNNREHQLYLLECERRWVELKLENARKNKEILELRETKRWIPHGEVPRIYVMA